MKVFENENTMRRLCEYNNAKIIFDTHTVDYNFIESVYDITENDGTQKTLRESEIENWDVLECYESGWIHSMTITTPDGRKEEKEYIQEINESCYWEMYAQYELLCSRLKIEPKGYSEI